MMYSLTVQNRLTCSKKVKHFFLMCVCTHIHTKWKSEWRAGGRRGRVGGVFLAFPEMYFHQIFYFLNVITCSTLKKKKKDSISANIFLLFISNKMAIKSANGLSFFPELKHIFFNITNLIRVFKLLRKVL